MKIAQIMVDSFEDVEALTTVDLLRRAGIEIDIIALYDNIEIISAHGVKIICDKLNNEVNLESYDGYILPGGPGTDLYDDSQELKEVITKANTDNKLIAAICAAPSYLAKLGLLRKRQATSFPGVNNILLNNEAILQNSKVVIDNNIITAQALGSAIDFSLEIIKYLKGNESSLKIKKEIYY